MTDSTSEFKRKTVSGGRGAKGWLRLAIDDMQAGDQFKVPPSVVPDEQYFRVRVSVIGKKLGFKMSVRSCTDGQFMVLRLE